MQDAGETEEHSNGFGGYVSWRDYERPARAAIAAMRAPSEAMVGASWKTTQAATPHQRMMAQLGDPAKVAAHKTRERWQAMIDEALK